jgi:dihydrofolate reductase
VSKPGPVIALVVAIGENGAIGRGGDLPWKLSTDLRYFRNVTLRKPIIMGRRTFESFPRALDQRLNIVLSRDPAYLAPGAIVVPSLDAALEEIMIVGGDDVFREVLPKASRIYLTEVHASPDADVWFTLDRKQWREISRERHEPGPKDDHAFSFVVLERV